MCMPVVVRVGGIDYLRSYKMYERMEHLHKTITRDLIAGERNHAVLPVDQFAKRFAALFSQGMAQRMPRARRGRGFRGHYAQALIKIAELAAGLRCLGQHLRREGGGEQLKLADGLYRWARSSVARAAAAWAALARGMWRPGASA